MKHRVIEYLLCLIFIVCISGIYAVTEAPNEYNDDGERTGKWVIEFDAELYESFDEEDTQYYGTITYSDGEIITPLKMYYLSDKLYFESQVWETNPIEIADGEVSFYWESGVIESKLNFAAGIKNGLCTYYNERGMIWQKGQYVNGSVSGDWEEYYDDGTKGIGSLESEEVKTGFWHYYYTGGNIQAQGWWLHGKKQQGWVYFTETGEIIYKGDYKDDVQTGTWTQYFSDNSYGQGAMTDFKKNGDWILYSVDEIKTMSGAFLDDKQEGTWNVFDKYGNPESTVKFINGIQQN